MRLLAALLLILGLAVPAAAQPLVRIEGKNFIAPDGSTLHLKGISLGNWLMPEGYMFKFEVAKSPRQIYSAFVACSALNGPPSSGNGSATPISARMTSASSGRPASTWCASSCTTGCS